MGSSAERGGEGVIDQTMVADGVFGLNESDIPYPIGFVDEI